VIVPGSRLMAMIFSVLEWIMLFVLLQLGFVLGTVVGLGVFGVFPAFFTCVILAQEAIADHGEIPQIARAWKLYKTLFWRANAVGLIGCLVGVVLFANVVYFNALQPTFGWALGVKVAVLLFLFLYLAVAVIVLPSWLDFRLPFKALPRLFLTGLGDIYSIITVIGSGIILWLLFTYATGLLIFVVVGIMIVVSGFVSRHFQTHKLANVDHAQAK